MKRFAESFVVREGMSLNVGERVEVYYNIQQGGFSIKSIDKSNPNNGKVVAYASNVLIDNASFHLNLNKLKQIHEQQRKTVYATVKGTFCHSEEINNDNHNRGYCNPYTTGKFIDFDSKEELKTASTVYFYEKFFSYL